MMSHPTNCVILCGSHIDDVYYLVALERSPWELRLPFGAELCGGGGVVTLHEIRQQETATPSSQLPFFPLLHIPSFVFTYMSHTAGKRERDANFVEGPCCWLAGLKQ